MPKTKVHPQSVNHKSLSFALKRPRITEKSSLGSAHNTYTFDVPVDFNKFEIAQAIYALYKVKPVRVNMVRIPSKNIVYRGKRGVKKGGKKAIVFLKKGDKIEFA